ncbi:MAG: hypothetical protein ACI4U0_06055 [Candidatus Aphodocola sp.]
MSNSYFTICSLFYSALLLFVYFSKKREKSLAKKTYAGLVISTFVGLILAILCAVTVKNYKLIPEINYVVSRLYLVYLIVWISLFTLYIIYISFSIEENSKKHKIIRNINFTLCFILSILIFVLPLKYVSEPNKIYSYGSAAQLVYVVSEIYFIICLLSMFSNPKKIKASKYAPLFVYLALGAFVMIIQSMKPELLLITSTEMFVTFLTYFTIEENNSSDDINNIKQEAVKKLEKEKK